jgi:hypothetical protein
MPRKKPTKKKSVSLTSTKSSTEEIDLVKKALEMYAQEQMMRKAVSSPVDWSQGHTHTGTDITYTTNTTTIGTTWAHVVDGSLVIDTNYKHHPVKQVDLSKQIDELLINTNQLLAEMSKYAYN